MAMVTFRQEPQVILRGFTSASGSWGRGATGLEDLGVGRNDNLDTVLKKVYKSNFDTTDCSLPMRYAIDNKLDVDQFVIYTDNETYAGKEHPFTVLKDYRKRSGIMARMVVVGMTSNGFSIADPNDPLSLDVVGFDTAAPALIANL
jgi:60 kDa SS-A/Ro ribonucleoprotein